MNERPVEPVVEPPNLGNESSNERDDWRSNVGSRQDSKDFTDRKINRFIRNLKDVSTRLTDEVIENKTEAVIESLREEIAELDRRLNNILDYSDDDQEVKITNIQFGGKNYNTVSLLREWKTDLDEAIYEKRAQAKEEQNCKKTKEAKAKSILSSNPIVKLEKDSDYLDFIESVK